MSINYTDTEITNGVLKFGPDIISKILADVESVRLYIERIEKEKFKYPIPLDFVDINKWCIPEQYCQMDIEEYLNNICPHENRERMNTELDLFRQRNMLYVLKTMRYIVDTLRKHNIVWGVGRGSSVASYVLFLLGVHKIDSVKYDLPIEEFFKGGENG